MEITGSVEGIIDLIGGGTDVVITPVVTSGTKIADVSVGGVEKDLYCPTPTAVSVTQVQQSGTKIATIGVNSVNTDIYAPESGGSDVEITPVVTSGTKIADVSVGGVEKDLYCPTPTAVSVTQVQQSGTKIATIGVDGVNTDIYAPESGSGGGVNYSTSEIKVGTYTENGVDYDLYEKTFKGVMDSNAYSISVSDLSIMNMVTINGKIWGNGVEYIMPFYSNNNYHGRLSYNYNSKQVWIETTSDAWSYYKNYEIHIFYTKTS